MDVEIKLTRAKIIFMLCRQSPYEFSETAPLDQGLLGHILTLPPLT